MEGLRVNAADNQNQTKAATWQSIVEHPRFQEADSGTREKIRGVFFDQVVRPMTPDTLLEEVQQEFRMRTDSEVFGSSSASQSVSQTSQQSASAEGTSQRSVRPMGAGDINIFGDASAFTQEAIEGWGAVANSQAFRQGDWQTRQRMRGDYLDSTLRSRLSGPEYSQALEEFMNATGDDVFRPDRLLRSQSLNAGYGGGLADQRALQERRQAQADNGGMGLQLPGQSSPGAALGEANSLPERAQVAGESQESGSILTDFGNLLSIGADRAALNTREVVRKTFGEGVVASIDRADEWLNGKESEALLSERIERNESELTTETTEARGKAWWDSEKGELGPAWSDWRSYFSGITESLPETAMTMAPSMMLSKGVYAWNTARGVAPKLAAKRAAMTATLAGGLSEGLLGGGASSREVRDSIRGMPEEQLRDSAAIQSLMSEGGLTFEQARDTLAEDASSQAFVTSGVITGAFGGMGDRALAGIITGGPTSRLGAALRGAVGEGVFEEMPQEAGQQASENLAMRRADESISVLDNVPNAALGGLAIGASMGAGMGAAAGGQREATGQESQVPDSGQSVERRDSSSDAEFERVWREHERENNLQPIDLQQDTGVVIDIAPKVDLIRTPRHELPSAEREARDSLTYGNDFKTLRAAAEQKGDADAVAELDAVSEQVSGLLEAEALSRTRGEPLSDIRERLDVAADRFAQVVDRINSPEAGGNTATGLDMPEAFNTDQEVEQAGEAQVASGEALKSSQPSENPDRIMSQRVPVERIQIDPEAYQFRSNVNQDGVDSRLEGVEKWDDLRAGNLVLHERLDGTLYAADGHHRINLARQLGQPDVNALILREADGVTVEEARIEAATANIAAGSATAMDAAKVFRNTNIKPSEAINRFDLPRKSPLVRDGIDIAKLGNDAFGAVLNGVVNEKDGATIGRAFSDPDQQMAAIDVFQRVQPTNDNQRELLANEVRQAGFAESQGEQGGLFGDDPAESLIGERVRVMDSLRQILLRDRRLFATLNDNAQTAEQAGNRIVKERNDALKNASSDAVALLERATTTPEINQQINDAARRVKDGETLASVTRELKEALLNGSDTAAAQQPRTPAPSSRPANQTGQDAGRSEQVSRGNNARTAGTRQQRVGDDAGQSQAAVTLKTDGKPFQTRKAVELSKRFRDTPNAQPVEVEGGWGFVVQGAAQADVDTVDTSPQRVEETAIDRQDIAVADPASQETTETTPRSAPVDARAIEQAQREQEADDLARWMLDAAGDFRDSYQGVDLTDLAIDVAEHAIQNGRRMTQAEITGLGERYGIPEWIVEDLSRQPFGIEGLLDRREPGARELRRRARESSSEPLTLETQTEESLAQREQAVQAAEQAEANQRNQEAQRAQADRDADDFVLSGSNRAADIAESRGQSDIFGAQPAQPSEPSTTAPKASRSRKPFKLNPRQQRASEAFGGAMPGDAITLTQDVGYARADNAYRVNAIGKDGSLDVTNIERGSSTVISQGEWASASRRAKAPIAEVTNRGAGSGEALFAVADDTAESSDTTTPPNDAPYVRDLAQRFAEHPALSGVRAIQSVTELPVHVLDTMEARGIDAGKVAGVYDPISGESFVVADNLMDTEEGVRRAVHEAVGHQGIHGVLGADLEKVMLQVYQSYRRSTSGNDTLREVRRAYPYLNPETDAGKVGIAEELVARSIERSDGRPALRTRVMAAIRSALRELFPGVAWTDADIQVMGERARRYMQNRQNRQWKNADDPAAALGLRSVVRASGGEAGVSVSEAQRTVDAFMARYQGNVPLSVRVAATQEELYGPQATTANVGRLKGAYHPAKGVMTIVAGNARGVRDIQRTLRHEILGHYGLNTFAAGEKRVLLDRILETQDSPSLAPIWETVRRNYADAPLDIQAEEVFAHVAEIERTALGQAWDRVLAGLQRALRVTGLSRGPLRLSEIHDVARLIGEGIREGRRSQQVFPATDQEQFSRETPVDEPSIRFSLKDKQPDSVAGPYGPNDSTGFALPDESWLNATLRIWADKMRPLKRLRHAIQQEGRAIEEEADPYLAEELYHGRLENDLETFRRQYVEPLAEGMAKAKISQADLDNYVYALHAPERNAVVAERNPNDPSLQDGGSGMSNAEAAEIIEKVTRSGKQAAYDRLAKIIHDITAVRRQAIREGGLETDDVMDAWEATYQSYVPLKGFANDEPEAPRIGKGFQITGKESFMVKGRRDRAASPSTQAIVDANMSLIRRRKNEVGNAFLSMVTDHPNPELWQVFTDESPDTERSTVRVTDPETGEKRWEVREQPVQMRRDDRYFKTKRAGRTYYIKVKDQRLLNAMRNVGPEKLGWLTRTAGAATRIMSSLMTSLNPEFLVTNFERDIQTALLNIGAEQTRDDGRIKGQRILVDTARDVRVAMRAAWRGLNRSKASKKAETREWDRWFQEFIEDGAKTGYFDMKDIDAQAKEISSMVRRADGSTLSHMLKARKKTADFVENINGAVENAVRLSAYVNSRRNGLTRRQAASLAKNLTVNFNRRGEIGTGLNATYMFANASIQGTMNFARVMVTLKNTPEGKSPMNVWARMNLGQKIGFGFASAAFALATLNRLLSDEDDDGVLFWDKVPDHVKERNYVLMTGWATGNPEDYIKIPLPYGYNVFAVAGTHLEAVIAGTETPVEAAKNLGLAVAGSFSPIGFEDSESLSGLAAKNLMPTLARSLVQLGWNEDFAARMIYRENDSYGIPSPESSLYMRSTPGAYKAISQVLNEITGGTQNISGGVDINPDVIQHLVNYYGGGAWSFVEKTADFAARSVTGQEVENYRTPFVGKVLGTVTPYQDQSLFYERRNELGQIFREAENRQGQEGVEFRAENREQIRLYLDAVDISNNLRDLRQERDIIEASDNLDDETKRDRLESVEERMKFQIDRFNRQYNALN